MPLVLDYEGTKAIYQRCADRNLTLPRFGYTNDRQIFGILLGAARFAHEHGIEDLSLGIFTTIGHYVMQQVPRYLLSGHVLPSKGGDPVEFRFRTLLGLKLATDFIRTATESEWMGLNALHVIHHYDHGHFTLPGGSGQRSPNEFLEDPEILALFSSVMFDDSDSSFEDNLRHSKDYRTWLLDQGTPKVLEGCFEEVAAGGRGKDSANSKFTDPRQIKEYLNETGFDLVVPNIGTDSVGGKPAAGLQWDILEGAHRLGVGPRLALHGFSSVQSLEPDQQKRLGQLGVVSMNAWSFMATRLGPERLKRAATILAHHKKDLGMQGYPLTFIGDEPRYDQTDDANFFLYPLVDQDRDFEVNLIANVVYETLDSLGLACLAPEAS
jgi:fructose/tagatose bisphosphate aldolase